MEVTSHNICCKGTEEVAGPQGRAGLGCSLDARPQGAWLWRVWDGKATASGGAGLSASLRRTVKTWA